EPVQPSGSGMMGFAWLFSQRGGDSQDALYESTAALAPGPEAQLSPDDRGCHVLLRHVVRGHDALDVDECPKGILELEDVAAGARHFGVGASLPVSQKPFDFAHQ